MYLNSMYSGRDNTLWNAVSSCDLIAVRRAVAAGADVNMTCADGRKEVAGKTRSNTGMSLLHHAVWIGSLPIFRCLVECGADIHGQGLPHGRCNGTGQTPLLFAVEYNRVDIVKYLLDVGANIHCANEQGYTALHLATKFNYLELVRLLLESGARTGMRTKDGNIARYLAYSKQGDMEKLFAKYDNYCKKRACPVLAPLLELKPVFGITEDPPPSHSPTFLFKTITDHHDYTAEQSFERMRMQETQRDDCRGNNNNLCSKLEHCHAAYTAVQSAARQRLAARDREPFLSDTNASREYQNCNFKLGSPGGAFKGTTSAYHGHIANGGTQNNGNIIGDRSTIRQSKLFRMYESGNEVKSILGQNNLCFLA